MKKTMLMAAVLALAGTLPQGLGAAGKAVKKTAKTGQFDTVEAQSFQLRDSSGAVKAVLNVQDGAPYLTLYNSKGVAGLSVNMGGDRPNVSFLNPDGNPTMSLSMQAGGNAFLSFARAKGGGVMLGFTDNGAPILILSDNPGVSNVALGLQADGTGALSLTDNQGKASVLLVGAKAPNASEAPATAGNGLFTAFDADHKVLWKAP